LENLGTTAGQSDLWESRRRAYAPVDPTYPSALRFQYVQYNSVSKSRDLGSPENLLASIRGSIGSAAGSNTLYFKVKLPTTARLGIRTVDLGAQAERWVSVGLLDAERKPIPLDEQGFGIPPRRIYNDPGVEDFSFQPGTYYFTITSSQWAKQDFELQLAVIGYTSLDGVAVLDLANEGRLGMVRPDGVVSLELEFDSSIPSSDILKLCDGLASGTLVDGGSYLTITGGVALYQLQMSSRFSTFFYIAGEDQMRLELQGDLQVTDINGYGY